MRFNSLRTRMTLLCLLLLAPFLFISTLFLVVNMSRSSEMDDEKRLQEIAYIAAKMVHEDDWETLPQLGAKLKAWGRGYILYVLDNERNIVWRSDTVGPKDPVNSEDDGWRRAYAKAPPHYGIVAMSPKPGALARLFQQWGVWGLVSIVLISVTAGTWLLVGRTLLPIRLLARQADAASAEDLSVRLNPPSPDAEMVELVGTMNGLLGRVSETAAVKGRFYAAASHELRTPLQALNGHLEVALSRKRTAEEYEDALQEAHQQANRLTTLVRDLLLLHQLDSQNAATAMKQPTDLGEVCERILAPLAPLIEVRELQMEVDLPDDIAILAVPSHAEILVRNLVENAVRYARAGGRITVRLSYTERAARLTVFNESLTALDPQRLFEPFYRPDAARDRRVGGNGLGLAICRAIARANGWTVTLQSNADGIIATALFGECEGGC